MVEKDNEFAVESMNLEKMHALRQRPTSEKKSFYKNCNSVTAENNNFFT